MIDSLPQARRAIGRAHPRDPSDIDGLTVWLQADRGVVLDSSGNVSEWRDRSGRGNHAVQATAGARPPAATDASGRRAVRTNNGKYLEIPSSADLDPAAIGFNVYVAYSSTSTQTGLYVVSRWAALAADQNWTCEVNGAANTAGGFYASETGTNTARSVIMGDASTGAIRVFRGRYDPAGQVRASLGGTAYGPTAIAGVKSTSGTCVIGTLRVGTVADLITLYAVAIFRRDLTSSEDVFVRDYLLRTTGAA
jgi:hypothetical protein